MFGFSGVFLAFFFNETISLIKATFSVKISGILRPITPLLGHTDSGNPLAVS